MKKYYKIVQKDNSNIKFLFHGINGTRVIPINRWVEADIKENVMDGHGTKYTCGIHIIDGLDNAREYLQRFRKTDRAIVECYAEGLRHKSHSKPYVFLADRVLIESDDIL